MTSETSENPVAPDPVGILRARAMACHPTVEPRVRFIVEAMTAGDFDAQVQMMLVEVWSLSPSRVSALTSEAARQIRALAGEDLQAQIAQRVASLDATKRLALSLTRTYVAGESIKTVPAPDVRAAIEVDKLVLTMLGAFAKSMGPDAATVHQLQQASPGPRFAELPLPEQRRLLTTRLAEVEAALEAAKDSGAVVVGHGASLVGNGDSDQAAATKGDGDGESR